jgi:phage terminase large subunit
MLTEQEEEQDEGGGALRLITPRVFAPLLATARYKGAWGGRGSGKSHFFAEYIIEACILNPGTRVVCLREIQKSLSQSVKLLIEDKIQSLGVGHLFRVLVTHIETPGGGIIIFQGMQNFTAESIKSLEGYHIAWFEEAQSMSAYSLGLLRPTLRLERSEMLFSWNPRSAADPVDQFLRSPEAPSNAVVVKANYEDNPWFPNVLREEMEYDKRRDPDRYAHVWLGAYQKHSSARVFHNWRIEEFDTPTDARFHFGADWGFSIDPTVLIRMFVVGRMLYIDQEVWKIGCEVDHIPALFAGSDVREPPRWDNPFGWSGIEGATKWPLRADNANPQTISYLRKRGFSNIAPSIKGKGSVEEGVEFLQSYDIVIHPRCTHVADEFSTYSYKIDKHTEEVLPELADKDNHTIDSIRYGIEPLRRAPSKPVFATYGQHASMRQ